MNEIQNSIHKTASTNKHCHKLHSLNTECFQKKTPNCVSYQLARNQVRTNNIILPKKQNTHSIKNSKARKKITMQNNYNYHEKLLKQPD